MIIGIGNDIVAISRIKQVMEKFGTTFLNKHFCQCEIDYANTKQGESYYQSIGAAWAVKESVAKALGTGISGNITLASIALNHNKNGSPRVELSGGALKTIQALSAGKKYRIFVAISHDAGMACAMAVIEMDN